MNNKTHWPGLEILRNMMIKLSQMMDCIRSQRLDTLSVVFLSSICTPNITQL